MVTAVTSSPTADELSRSTLLRGLGAEELREVAPLFRLRRMPKGAIVAVEGEPLDWFNIVLAGRVGFFWRDEDGRQVDVAFVEPGEDFALQSLRGEPMLTSAIALEDLRLASMRVAEFETLLLARPHIALAYIRSVVGLFRRSVAYRKAFTMDDVYVRIARLFTTTAVPTDGVLVVAEPLTQAAIGRRVGATREMVGKVMRDLVRGGYLAVHKGRITILRPLPRRW